MPLPGDNTVPAGNIGNLIMNMLFGQQNDPRQQMANWEDEQQRRNRAAAGLDYQGNLLPTPQLNAQPGVGSGQITNPAIAAQVGNMLPANQTPNAYKTEPSLGSLILSSRPAKRRTRG